VVVGWLDLQFGRAAGSVELHGAADGLAILQSGRNREP